MIKNIKMTPLTETESETRYWTLGPSEADLKRFSTEPLFAFAFSSLVTAGPDAHQLRCILEAINSACFSNDPKTVMGLCAWLLVNEKTSYMEVSMIEVILAYSRACTVLHPELSFIRIFSSLYRVYFKKEVN